MYIEVTFEELDELEVIPFSQCGLVQVRESEEQYKYFRQNIMKMRY